MTFAEVVQRSRETGCNFWRDHERFRRWVYRWFPEDLDMEHPELIMVRRIDGVGSGGFSPETHIHWMHASADDWTCDDVIGGDPR